VAGSSYRNRWNTEGKSLSEGELVKIATHIFVILLGLALPLQGTAQTEATSSQPTKQEKAQALAQDQQREDAQKSQKKAQKDAEKSQKKAQKDAQKSQKKAQKQWNQQHPSAH
jgi:hypothetical protein